MTVAICSGACSEAKDLALIRDVIRFLKTPRSARGNQLIEVLHGPVFPDESVARELASSGCSDNLPMVIYSVSAGGIKSQGTEILHVTFAVEKRMRLGLV